MTRTRQEVDTLYVLTGSAGVLYAARASGLYRSRDAGATWHNTFSSLDNAETMAAVAVVAHGDTVFAGVNGAVLRSDDAGESWAMAPLASPPPLVAALAVSPRFEADGVVLAGTAEDGVFISGDRGNTWVPWNFGLIDMSVYALAVSPDFADEQTVFAGTQSGVFVSRSGGRGWRDLPFPEDAAPVQCLQVTPDGTLYAGTENLGLYVSSDAGNSWRRLAPDVFPTGIQALQATPQLYVLTDDALLCSDDAGQTWRQPAPTFAIDNAAMVMTPLDGTDAWLIGFADGEVVRVFARGA